MLELGKYEKEGHQVVGKRAAEIVHHLITVGKLGKHIAETALGAGLAPTAIETVETSLEAAELLKYHLADGDIVLIKGSHGLRMDHIASILENS
jgi:UDP-N-acetylmuramoyl-tripeptide--D-alanyl-D-alanine ligase